MVFSKECAPNIRSNSQTLCCGTLANESLCTSECSNSSQKNTRFDPVCSQASEKIDCCGAKTWVRSSIASWQCLPRVGPSFTTPGLQSARVLPVATHCFFTVLFIYCFLLFLLRYAGHRKCTWSMSIQTTPAARRAVSGRSLKHYVRIWLSCLSEIAIASTSKPAQTREDVFPSSILGAKWSCSL